MKCLHDDVLYTICLQEKLSHVDVLRLSRCSKRLRVLCLSETAVWRPRFAKCYPRSVWAYDVCEFDQLPLRRRAASEPADTITWLELCVLRAKLERVISAVLRALSQHYIMRDTIGITGSVALRFLTEECAKRGVGEEQTPRITALCTDILRELCNDESKYFGPSSPNEHLTLKYYGEQLLFVLLRPHLERRLLHLLNAYPPLHAHAQERPQEPPLKDNVHHFVEALLIFARYVNPRSFPRPDEFVEFLQSLVDNVKKKLSPSMDVLVELPDVGTSLEGIQMPKWTNTESDTIIDTLCSVFVENNLFEASSANTFERYDEEILGLDQVADSPSAFNTRPIAYCALFHICAMYLGVHTELLNVPMRLCLLCSWARDSSRLIDVASKCARYSFEGYAEWLSAYSRRRIDALEDAAHLNYRQILFRMLLNIEQIVEEPPLKKLRYRRFIELRHIVSERRRQEQLRAAAALQQVARCDFDRAIELIGALPPASGCPSMIQAYMLHEELLHEMNREQANEIAAEAAFAELRSNRTNERVKFRCGEIMRHRLYGYRCVIRGWNHICMMSFEWQNQMGVPHLPHGANQPFYHVLADDGSIRYAAQENLENCDDVTSACKHDDVPKYFQRLANGKYEMNEALKAFYPED